MITWKRIIMAWHGMHSTAQQNIAVHVSVARASCGRRCVAPPNALSLTVAFLPLLVAMKAKAKQLNSIALFAFTSSLCCQFGGCRSACSANPSGGPPRPSTPSLSFFLLSQATQQPEHGVGVWSVWTVTRVFMQVSAAVAAHTSLRKAQAALLLPAPAAARLKANGFFCHTAYKSCLSLSPLSQ
jgi:hypothetical protein